ncbi:MAG: nickel pincer cofactor biosynthesis protein LarB [Desulfosalsimonadaceae bacterium]
MDKQTLKQILTAVSSGRSTVDEAAAALKNSWAEDIGYAHIDHHRSIRKGFPEVIFAPGKNAEQIIGIMTKMAARETVVLVTRLDPDKAETVKTHFPRARYHEDARLLLLSAREIAISGSGTILVVSAGTSDIPVAREALLTAHAMGNAVDSVFDVGVAGIHRLFHYKEKLEAAAVLIVVAGMEGALPSVVAGLVDRPVIGVPTSVGYGAGLNGFTALFSMLSSCSSNVAVVNIDNGFGAGYMASMINHLPNETKPEG